MIDGVNHACFPSNPVLMNRVPVGAVLFLIVSCCVAGCSQLMFWNPTFRGGELDKTLAMNFDGLAVTVEGLGFINSSYGPYVTIRVGNFTNEAVIVEPAAVAVTLGGETIVPSDGTLETVDLAVGEEIEIELQYDYGLGPGRLHEHDGNEHYIPEPSRLVLRLGKMISSIEAGTLPDIEYVYAYRRFQRTRFL